MEFLLIYSFFLVFVLIPPIQIFRSQAIGGRKKAIWVAGCVISMFVPAALVSIGLVIAIKFWNYEITGQALMFGPESIIFGAVNILSFSLPWIIYSMFKSKYVTKKP